MFCLSGRDLHLNILIKRKIKKNSSLRLYNTFAKIILNICLKENIKLLSNDKIKLLSNDKIKILKNLMIK